VVTTQEAAKKSFTNSPERLDQRAFSLLYQDYSPALFGALNKVLKNTTLAEDALQNTFMKIWLYKNSYDSGKASLFTWMLNIARNEAIDVLRSKQFRYAQVTTSLLGREIALTKSPFHHLDHVDLQKHLCLLKPMERVILELCFFRGFSCEQTAMILQIPCGTVKTKMQQGYKKLRAALS
jgi:RNA polymerase sigma factor (sigma-70 family)